MMNAKTKEAIDMKCNLSYIIGTMSIFIIILILPGMLNHNYVKFFGTVVFLFLSFMAIRSYVIAFSSMGSCESLSQKENEWPSVSIIVSAYYEEEVLDRTIQSILKLDYPEDKVEILYVYESHCTDRTEDIILKYALQDPRIKPIKKTSKSGGHAAANNYGISFAKGQIIGVFDADQSLNPDLLKKAVTLFNKPSIGCVRGRCRVINRDSNLLSRVVALERDAIERIGIYGAYKLGGFANFGGAHGFFRREIFEEIGLFDEEILCEDIDLSVRLHMAGYEIMHIPELQSWEEVPTRVGPWWTQRKRWARGWMQVWRKYNLNVLRCKNMSKYKKIDTFFSLAASLSPIFTIFTFPLIFLSYFGYETTFFSRTIAQSLWGIVTFAPFATAILVWALDSRDYGRQPLAEIPASLLLIPYIFLQFTVNWLALMDEFILNRPSSFIKTGRDCNRAPHCQNSIAVFKQI
jgi:cellulose synthase/poly-beta-1,6-N-acetylglucosamine synthase-like glycosyltransferase